MHTKGPDPQAVHITSINLVPQELEDRIKDRFKRYETVKINETRYEILGDRSPDLYIVAYGTSARIALGARQLAAKEGINLGIFRPITLWPFPYEALGKLAETGKPFLTVEMSMGQLVEDVRLAVLGRTLNGTQTQVHLLGHCGGVIPTEEEVFAEAKRILGR
jgi:2-oxoglutarate ferredoxin oxidoreductase subunit alpha